MTKTGFVPPVHQYREGPLPVHVEGMSVVYLASSTP